MPNKKKTKSRHIDRMIAGIPRLYADSQTGYLAQQLAIHTMTEVFRHKRSPRKWVGGGLIDFDTSVPVGAPMYAFREVEGIGEAKIVAPDATDYPEATIRGEQTIRNTHLLGIQISYSKRELEVAAHQNFNLVEEKVAAARVGHDITLNRFIRSGKAGTDLRGIVNHPGIIVASAITGDWPTASAVEIEADVTAGLNFIKTNSDEVYMPHTVLFDTLSWTIVTTKPRGPGDNTLKVIDALKAAFPEVVRWDSDPGLKDVSKTGSRSMLAYTKERSHVSAVMPEMMMPQTPFVEGGDKFIMKFRSVFGGVKSVQPKSILRLDGI